MCPHILQATKRATWDLFLNERWTDAASNWYIHLWKIREGEKTTAHTQVLSDTECSENPSCFRQDSAFLLQWTTPECFNASSAPKTDFLKSLWNCSNFPKTSKSARGGGKAEKVHARAKSSLVYIYRVCGRACASYMWRRFSSHRYG